MGGKEYPAAVRTRDHALGTYGGPVGVGVSYERGEQS